MSPFFIDFEAFQVVAGEYILKELCIIDSDKPLLPLYYIFAPPYDWDKLGKEHQKTCEYLINHYHRLGWDEGYSEQCGECITRNTFKEFPTTAFNGLF